MYNYLYLFMKHTNIYNLYFFIKILSYSYIKITYNKKNKLTNN